MTADTGLSVGVRLPPLRVGPISRTDLALFCGGSGDHNPMHVDIDFARSAGMDDVFAHGMLSMAYLGRLLTNWVPQHRLRSLRVRFVAITPVGARPTLVGTVTHVAEGSATIELTATLDDGTTTATGVATIRIDEEIQ